MPDVFKEDVLKKTLGAGGGQSNQTTSASLRFSFDFARFARVSPLTSRTSRREVNGNLLPREWMPDPFDHNHHDFM